MNKKTGIIIGVFALFAILAIVVGIIFGLQMVKKSDSNSEEAMLNKEIHKLDIGEMYCNLSESKKIVKINTTVETPDKKFFEVLEGKVYIIRHEINEIIRGKKQEEVEGSEGQKNVQAEVVKRLNEVFKTKLITDVYFNDFIVQ